MSESLQQSIKRSASRGGWKSYFVHALGMLVVTWPIFIATVALTKHQMPVSLRAVVMSSAEATGYYLIPLAISWVVLRFSKVAGWIAWLLLVGLMSWLLLANSAVGRASPPPMSQADDGNQFRITTPPGWGSAPLAGRIVWHVAANGGTEQPDCGVIISQDSSFAIGGNDGYIEGQSKEKLKDALSLNFQDVVIGYWEPSFALGGQRALHHIYSGAIDGQRQTTLGIQTVRDDKLYSFFCNAPSDKFPFIYLDLLKISDTFFFTQ